MALYTKAPFVRNTYLAYDAVTGVGVLGYAASSTPEADSLTALTDSSDTTAVVASLAPKSRTNLIANPNFETDITGFQTNNVLGVYTSAASVTQSSDYAYAGTKSAKVVQQTTTNKTYAGWYLAGLTPGTQYTFSAYVRVPAGSPNVRAEVLFYASSAWTSVKDSWVRVSCTTTIPSGGTAFFGVTADNTVTGGTFYVDAGLFEIGTTVGSYFQGTQVGNSTPVTTVRTNLVPNPSMETDAKGWLNGPNNTTVRTTSQAYVGTGSLQVSQAAAYNIALSSVTMPVQAGLKYAAQARIRASAAGIAPQIAINWWNAAGTVVDSAAMSATLTAPTASWALHSVIGTAPVGAVNATVAFYVTTPPANQFLYIDAVMLEQSDTVGTYFDSTTAPTATTTYASVTTPTTVIRTNRVLNPSFETAITSWDSSGSTLTQSSTYAWLGTKSLRVQSAQTGLIWASTGMSVAGGAPVAVSLYVRSSVARSATLVCYGIQGSNIITLGSKTLTTTTTGWTRFQVITSSAGGVNGMNIYLNIAGSAVNDLHYIDGFLFEDAATMGTGAYFDGSTANTAAGNGYTTITHAWSGTANASASTETIATTQPVSTATTLADSSSGGISRDRTNLLINPSFEVDTGGWTTDWSGDWGFDRVVSTAAVGAASGQLSWYGSSTVTGMNVTAKNTTPIAVTGSKDHAFQFQVTGSEGVSARPVVTWYSGTTLVGTSTGVAITAGYGIWKTVSMVATAPSSANIAQIAVNAPSINSNQTLLVDALLFEQSSAIDPYFDGDTTDTSNWSYYWLGAASASRSAATYIPGVASQDVRQLTLKSGVITDPTQALGCTLNARYTFVNPAGATQTFPAKIQWVDANNVIAYELVLPATGAAISGGYSTVAVPLTSAEAVMLLDDNYKPVLTRSDVSQTSLNVAGNYEVRVTEFNITGNVLTPEPDIQWRNLVINPSGEQLFDPAWVVSGSTVGAVSANSKVETAVTWEP
jgi:hypothetical protein